MCVCDLRFTLSLSLQTLDLHQFLDNTLRRILNPLSDLAVMSLALETVMVGNQSAG